MTTFIVGCVLAALVSLALVSSGRVDPFTLMAGILGGRRLRRERLDDPPASERAEADPPTGNPPLLSRPLRGRADL